MGKKQIPHSGGLSYVERQQLALKQDRKRQRKGAINFTRDAAIIAANEVFHRRGDKIVEFANRMTDIMMEMSKVTLEDSKDLQYTKQKVDERLKDILGEEHFEPWDVRYGL